MRGASHNTRVRRLVSPIVLRQFLLWLSSQGTTAPDPVWKGYLLAVAMGACAMGVTMVQHQQPWYAWLWLRSWPHLWGAWAEAAAEPRPPGQPRRQRRQQLLAAAPLDLASTCGPHWCRYGSLLGYLMRQEVIAVVHAKLMRLNATAVSAISPGFLINLVSNDVRRFDDGLFYWLYIWAAPLELACVFAMVATELDALAALAGISISVALIPLQVRRLRPWGACL